MKRQHFLIRVKISFSLSWWSCKLLSALCCSSCCSEEVNFVFHGTDYHSCRVYWFMQEYFPCCFSVFAADFSSYQSMKAALTFLLKKFWMMRQWMCYGMQGRNFQRRKNHCLTNPYEFFPQQKADSIVHQLYSPSKDSVISILTTDRPNIVLFVLESFTADVIEALQGEKGVTPNLGYCDQSGLALHQYLFAGLSNWSGTLRCA